MSCFLAESSHDGDSWRLCLFLSCSRGLGEWRCLAMHVCVRSYVKRKDPRVRKMQGSESVSGAASDRDVVNGVGEGALTGKMEEEAREEPLVQTGVGARMCRVVVSG